MSERRTSGIVAGKVLGAPVIIQPSTLVMLAVLAFVFASSAGETTTRTLAIGLTLALSLFASMFLHEVAHGIAARAFGRKVDEIVLTLWGGHTSFDERSLTPMVTGVVAVAGPTMNFVVAGAASASLEIPGVGGLLETVLAYLVLGNVLLGFFNLLPGFPMDGGRVLEAIVWRLTGNEYKGTFVAAWLGRIVAVGVVIYSVASPLLAGMKPSIINVVFALIVFSVLWPAASSAIKFSKAMLKRDAVTVASLMAPAVGVPYTVSVEGARQAAAAAGVTEIVVLGADDAPAGRFSLELTEQVPADLRDATSLQSVTTPIPRGAAIEREATSELLLPELRQWWGKTDVLVVVEETTVVGILRLVDVVAALS